jgi:rubrerythrin
MSKLFKRKHELWLEMLFGAFSVESEEVFNILYDFAMIEYRHLVWLGGSLVEMGEEFDYDRDQVEIEVKTNHELYDKLIKKLKEMDKCYPQDAMYERFSSDERYFIDKLEFLKKGEDEKIRAFDRRKEFDGYELNRDQLEALILFLFEESYKEYELILVYTYSDFYTDSKLLSSIFKDLIYESHFHLKSFARMMSKMGLLALPRVVARRVYQFDDLREFLIDGIKEEEGAKEMCLKLAKDVGHPEFSKFFEFINDQESYHIELMKKALNHIGNI